MIRSIRIFLVIFAGCCMGLSSCQSYSPLHPVVSENNSHLTDPGIVQGVLPNGFQYIIKNNTTPEHRVSIHLNVFSGSMNEDSDELGLAHYLEHMVFNGSEHFEPGALARFFPSIGMDFGADANAQTSFFNTVYDLKLPSREIALLDKAFLIIQDYARGALLLEEEIERERGIILSEKRERDSVSYRTFKQTLAFELPDSLFVRRFPIGTEQIIQTADHKRLKKFYDRWYRPDNMALVVVGDLDIPRVRKMIIERFSRLKPAVEDISFSDLETGWTPHEGIKPFYYFEPESGNTDVTIETLEWVPFEKKTPDVLKQQMLRHICASLIQNRLNRMLVDETAYFSDASSFSGVYLQHVSMNAISATCSAEQWDKTLVQLENVLRQAVSFGFDYTELSRVKADVLAALEQRAEQSETRDTALVAKRILSTIQQNGLILSDDQRLALLKPYIMDLSLEDIHGALKSAWSDDSRLIIVTGNAQLEKSTAAQTIRDIFDKAVLRPLEKYQASHRLPFPYLEPGKHLFGISSRRHYDAPLDITTIEYENNIRLNLKQTDFSQNEVLFKVCFGSGKKNAPETKPGLALITQMLLDESGFGKMDMDQLHTALAGKKVSFSFGVGEQYFLFSGAIASDESVLMMQLIYHFFHDPGYRESILSLLKSRYRQEYNGLIRTPEGIMQIKGIPFLTGSASGFIMPHPDIIDRYTVEDVKEWVDDQIQTQGLEISIIGDFNLDHMVSVASGYLGGFDMRKSFKTTTYKEENIRFPAGETLQLKFDSKVEKEVVRLAFRTDDFWNISQTRRLNILARVFSERLREKVREELGETYSPYVFNAPAMIYKDFGLMHVVVNVAEGKSQKIFAAVDEILQDMHSSGVSENETRLALKPLLTHLQTLQHSNSYWLNSVMAGSVWHPDKFIWAGNLMEDYASIHAGDISELVERFLDIGNSARMVISSDKNQSSYQK